MNAGRPGSGCLLEFLAKQGYTKIAAFAEAFVGGEPHRLCGGRRTWAVRISMATNIFITDERQAWMRRRDHTVVFGRDPEFFRFAEDPSGSVLRIVRIWVANAGAGSPNVRHCVGSVRRCECSGWMSHRELVRLFRQATITARLVGESAGTFRGRLSDFLRGYFIDEQGRNKTT